MKYSLCKNTPEFKSFMLVFQKSFLLIRLINSLHANLSYNFFTKLILLLHCPNLLSTKFQADSFPAPFAGAMEQFRTDHTRSHRLRWSQLAGDRVTMCFGKPSKQRAATRLQPNHLVIKSLNRLTQPEVIFPPL